jgi:hypothetical protein
MSVAIFQLAQNDQMKVQRKVLVLMEKVVETFSFFYREVSLNACKTFLII